MSGLRAEDLQPGMTIRYRKVSSESGWSEERTIDRMKINKKGWWFTIGTWVGFDWLNGVGFEVLNTAVKDQDLYVW